VHKAVEHQLGATPSSDPPTRGLTDRCKRAVELSVEEANRMRHSWVGTQHLLLGLLSEGGGIAACALRVVGCADLDELRRRVVFLLNDG
jgi:ATP-dependent Clp protease ATP-binding subunit ClpC